MPKIDLSLKLRVVSGGGGEMLFEVVESESEVPKKV